jgi:hypothetical protein
VHFGYGSSPRWMENEVDRMSVDLTSDKFTLKGLSKTQSEKLIEGLKHLKQKYLESLAEKEKEEKGGWTEI